MLSMATDIETPGSKYLSTRRRSEAELLTFDVSAKTSKYVQQLSLDDGSRSDLRTKFQSGLQISSNSQTNADVFPPTSPAPTQQKSEIRRASMSALEEVHLCKAMNFGAFQSEAGRARKDRRKSFEKVRRRSSEEKKKERKASGN